MKTKQIVIGALSLIGALSSLNAQVTLDGASDDFNTDVEYNDPESGRGVYWWAEESTQTITRDSDNEQLLVEMTQALGMYTPFGVGFGDSNGEAAGGTPYTIDLSQNGTFSFDVKNIGTESIAVRVACIDVNDRLRDSSPGATEFGQIWQYQTQIIVQPGDSMTFEAGTPNSAGGGKSNSGDFTLDVWGDYGTHIIRTDCDLTKIKGINITVLNGEKDPDDGHAVALTDGKFTISNFKVGNVAVGIGDHLSKKNEFTLFPNPTTDGQVTFGQLLTNVKVYTPQGVLLSSFGDARQVNLGDRMKGVYVIHSDQGYSRVVVE